MARLTSRFSKFSSGLPLLLRSECLFIKHHSLFLAGPFHGTSSIRCKEMLQDIMPRFDLSEAVGGDQKNYTCF